MKWWCKKQVKIMNSKTDTLNRSTMKMGFIIDTKIGLWLITVLGIILYFFTSDTALLWVTKFIAIEEIPIWIKTVQSFVHFLGETFIGAGIISIIISIHTINETQQKVRDNLLLNDPSFIERYTDEETNKLLRYSIQQKFLLNTDAQRDDVLDAFAKDLPEVFFPVFQHTIDQFGKYNFCCERHYRNIRISPIQGNEYDIDITLDMLLYNFSQEDVQYDYWFELKFMSERQTDSFVLESLKINDKDETDSIEDLQKIIEPQPATQSRPFNHFLSFKIPLFIRAKDRCRCVLNYKYKSYYNGCLMTYSLPFAVRQYREVYSLVGPNADGYHLKVLAFSPFTKNHSNNQDLVQKDNNQTYSINVDDWSLPGTGFAAVVRKQ